MPRRVPEQHCATKAGGDLGSTARGQKDGFRKAAMQNGASLRKVSHGERGL